MIILSILSKFFTIGSFAEKKHCLDYAVIPTLEEEDLEAINLIPLGSATLVVSIKGAVDSVEARSTPYVPAQMPQFHGRPAESET